MGIAWVILDASARSDPLQAHRILIWLLRIIGQALRIHLIESVCVTKETTLTLSTVDTAATCSY